MLILTLHGGNNPVSDNLYSHIFAAALDIFLEQKRLSRNIFQNLIHVLAQMHLFAERAAAIFNHERKTEHLARFFDKVRIIHIKKGQRFIINSAIASMGYDLPAAIGVCRAVGREMVCISGDGSIQMNLQELQTLLTYQIPMKLFVYNNAGYLSIKTTQKAFFGGKFVGSEASSGVILPSFEKLAAAYGLPYFKLENNQELDAKLPQIFATPGPVLIEVILDPFEILGPKAASKKLPDGRMVSAPLEDMAPFLPRDEFQENMLIKPLDEQF